MLLSQGKDNKKEYRVKHYLDKENVRETLLVQIVISQLSSSHSHITKKAGETR